MRNPEIRRTTIARRQLRLFVPKRFGIVGHLMKTKGKMPKQVPGVYRGQASFFYALLHLPPRARGSGYHAHARNRLWTGSGKIRGLCGSRSSAHHHDRRSGTRKARGAECRRHRRGREGGPGGSVQAAGRVEDQSSNGPAPIGTAGEAVEHSFVTRRIRFLKTRVSPLGNVIYDGVGR